MGADWIVKAGDTAPAITHQLRDKPVIGQGRVGAPVDLTSAAVVAAICHLGKTQIWAAVATIENAATGEVSTPLAAEVTATAGLVRVEWVVTWTDGSQQTFPATAAQPYNSILVRRSLTAPTVYPTPAPLPAIVAPLFISDGQTGIVAASGQPVMAGANSTVSVPAGVTFFTIAHHPGQTPWTAGTTPTIAPVSGAVDAGVVLALLASGGDEVTLITDGTTWFATTPSAAAGGADKFVDHGPTLPDPGAYFATGIATFTKTDDADGVKIGNYITDGSGWLLDQ